MSLGEEDNQPPVVYALRLTQRALSDIDTAYMRFLELTEQVVADAWKEGLFEAVALLSRMPNRYAVVSEAARFRQEVRQLVYRSVIALRHGARKPISKTEAQEIERGE